VLHSRSPKIALKHAKILICAGIVLTSIIAQAQVGGTAALGVTGTELREVVTLGWSAKRQVLGEPVYNEKSERIGTVDDIVIAPDMARSYAIIGVGSFLGVGKRDVVVRLSQLIRQVDGSFVLVGATRDVLKALPPFEYAR
jgi:sporulation protein YlmC with PRC-barrel domain